MELRLDEKELNAEEILRLTYKFLKECLPALFPFFIIYIAMEVVSSFVQHYIPHDTPSHAQNILYYLLDMAVSWGTFWFANTLCILSVDEKLNGSAIKFGKVASKSLWLLPFVLWAQLLASIFLGIGSLLFLVPGIILFVEFYFVAYAVIFEKKKGLAALKYSMGIAKFRWWRVFKIALILFIFTSGPYAYWTLLDYLVTGKTIFTFTLFEKMTATFVSSIVQCFFIPAGVIFFRNFQNFIVIPERDKKPVPDGPAPTW